MKYWLVFPLMHKGWNKSYKFQMVHKHLKKYFGEDGYNTFEGPDCFELDPLLDVADYKHPLNGTVLEFDDINKLTFMRMAGVEFTRTYLKKETYDPSILYMFDESFFKSLNRLHKQREKVTKEMNGARSVSSLISDIKWKIGTGNRSKYHKQFVEVIGGSIAKLTDIKAISDEDYKKLEAKKEKIEQKILSLPDKYTVEENCPTF